MQQALAAPPLTSSCTRRSFLRGGGATRGAPQPVVELAARQAHIGEAEWLPLLDACLRGNDFVIIGSIFPVHPAALMSLPRRPIRRPEDLPGCRFLVQGPSERTAIEAMFKLNHLPPD
jgi:hypothetical protein